MKQPLFSASYAPRDGESTLDEIENAPDRAIWVALKALSLGVTAASRDVFGVGASGRSFLAKGKPWYDALEHQFGAIKE